MVRDVTQADFEQHVVERSREVPACKASRAGD